MKNTGNGNKPAMPKSEHTALVISQIKKHLESSIGDDKLPWEISRRVGISRYHMTRLFEKYTGMTLIEYKRHYRMEKAMHLLVERERSISEIALEYGYASTTYFSSSF